MYTGLFSKTLRTPFLFFANSFPFLYLMDYPYSEEEGGTATDGAAMLDDDDTEIGEGMSPAPPGTGAGTSSGNPSTNPGTPEARKRPGTGSSFMSCGSQLADRPDFPPIYCTVKKEKEKAMVTRHLNGGAPTGTESTNSGAYVSKVETIGSFASAGYKRHNHTMHRYDFKIFAT